MWLLNSLAGFALLKSCTASTWFSFEIECSLLNTDKSDKLPLPHMMTETVVFSKCVDVQVHSYDLSYCCSYGNLIKLLWRKVII